MSNFEYYKDNILTKLKQVDELEAALKWSHNFKHAGEKIVLNSGLFAPIIKVDKEVFEDIIQELIDRKMKLIKLYNKLSFKEEIENELKQKENGSDNLEED